MLRASPPFVMGPSPPFVRSSRGSMSYSLTYHAHVCSKKGEDRHAFLSVTLGVRAEPVLLVLVADGHGGSIASAILAEQLLPLIAADAADASIRELERAIALAFTSMHVKIRARSSTAGSTATVIAISPSRGTITCGNVGDSYAFAFRRLHDSSPQNSCPLSLTKSHRLEDDGGAKTAEARRILAAGGKLARVVRSNGKTAGPLRAWPGGLAMGRALGDADCGDWLLASPSVFSCPLAPHGCDICLATDGIWDAVTLAESHALIARWQPLARSAKDLVDAAIRRKGCASTRSAALSAPTEF